MPSPACERAQRGRVVCFVVGQGRRQPGGRAGCPGKGSEDVWSLTPRERHTSSACRSLSFPFVLVVEPIRRVTAGLSRYHQSISTARYYPSPLSHLVLAPSCCYLYTTTRATLLFTRCDIMVGGRRRPHTETTAEGTILLVECSYILSHNPPSGMTHTFSGTTHLLHLIFSVFHVFPPRLYLSYHLPPI